VCENVLKRSSVVKLITSLLY